MSFGHKFRDRLGLLSKPNKEGKGPSVGSQIQAASKTMQFSLTTPAKSLLKQSSANTLRSSVAASSRAQSSASNSHAIWLQGSAEIVTPNYLASNEVSPTQFPSRFEFSEKYLIALNCHIHTCQFGTFLLNSERERASFKFKDASGNLTASIGEATHSVWNFFEHHKSEFLNELYTVFPGNTGKSTDEDVLNTLLDGMGLYSGQVSFGSESLGEIQQISAATISSMRVFNKQAVTASFSERDNESDDAVNANDGLTNTNAAFSTTAAHVSSLASIASNSWWTVNGAATTASIATDPLVDQYQDGSSKYRQEPPHQQHMRAPSIDMGSRNSSTIYRGESARLSLQERLAKTVYWHDLKKRERNNRTNSSSNNSVESFKDAVQSHQQSAVFEPVDNSAAVVGSGYQNLRHPLWQG
ncbi:Myotubularin- protein 7 [Physocladia obscura]|uniref:Myotubularin- protein 7 n=1 Tax=Physocladia obscura TaxID=109957 RepID=A0AAD5X693_9FUNG|nr:Myotubularin- protein 7 [Physocladia obscura]